MKKFTKVLMAAVAVSTLCFAGCKNANDLLGEEFIDYTTKANKETGAEATASIDYTNEESAFKRGIRLLDGNKKAFAVNVIMEDVSSNPGFMSVIFNKTVNDDKTVNFISLGYRADGNAKLACTYYRNVSTSDFEESDFGKEDTNKNSLDDDIQELIALWKDSGISAKDGKLTVGFVITAKKGDTPYEIRVYGNKTASELDEIADAINTDTTDDDGVIGNPYMFEIKNSDLDREADADTIIEGGIGFYANVYGKRTLKGEWQVADISHNPDGIIWEDEIPNTLNIQLAE